MGMYTELNIGVQFKSDAPNDVIEAMKIMTDGVHRTKDDVPESVRGHPLFETERWLWMLRSGGSYYFDGKPQLTWEWDKISNAWYLSVRTNIKNYSSEWQAFTDFIAPHLETSSGPFIGYCRYEEALHPTLLYLTNGKIHWIEVNPIVPNLEQ